jgi:two-component system sensor kinase FixL
VGRVASMGELTASIAHELNQPLTAILSNAQVAQRLIGRGTADPEELKEILADIVADDRRAGDVIRQLRAFVRKDETQRVPLDINGIVQDVVSLVRSDAIARNVSVAVGLSPEVPAVVADRIQLQQVVLNLVMNGLEAMREAANRDLLVTTGIDGEGAVSVTVIDHGEGIAEHDLRRIFEPFYTTKPQGLGMGLAIARSLVESHGGRLWADNHKDGGATFAFTIPASGTGAE